MEKFTVTQLRDACDELIGKGLGDRKVLISQDDECNGYHGVYWGFASDPEEVETGAYLFHDNDDPADVVLLA